jgi:hypothetical protein
MKNGLVICLLQIVHHLKFVPDWVSLDLMGMTQPLMVVAAHKEF